MRNRLLINHFLRRLLDNDLVSPHADRHVVLSVGFATLTTLSLFVTVLIATKYQAPFQPPGRTAVSSVDDKFLYFAWSMLVMSLFAALEWNALALDARDTLILGPLPIPHATITRTKIAATVILASGLVVTLNAVPSLMYPWGLCAQLPIGMLPVVGLMATHGTISVLAGAFGFMSVLGLRESLYAILGDTRFSRISTVVQVSLLVFLLTTALLLPGRSTDIASWLSRRPAVSNVTPPVWFVGLHEALAGGAIDRLPRIHLPARVLLGDNKPTALYRSLHSLFQDLATIAVLAVIVVMIIAIAACAWNSRRLPLTHVRRGRGDHALHKILVWTATHFIVRRPTVQAGFFFALQSLARSVPHRLSMVTSVAVALAVVVVTLGGRADYRAPELSSVPLSILALQTFVIAALLTGFRQVVRVPADARANWTFHLAWSGDERPFLAGVKRAGLVVLVAPALALFCLWYTFVLGPQTAFEHVVVGLLFALLLIEAFFVGSRTLPFASAYVPPEHLKSLIGLYLVVVVNTAFGLAWVERQALATSAGTTTLIAALTALLVTVRLVDVILRRTRVTIDLDELPSSPTQRLELSR